MSWGSEFKHNYTQLEIVGQKKDISGDPVRSQESLEGKWIVAHQVGFLVVTHVHGNIGSQWGKRNGELERGSLCTDFTPFQ